MSGYVHSIGFALANKLVEKTLVKIVAHGVIDESLLHRMIKANYAKPKRRVKKAWQRQKVEFYNIPVFKTGRIYMKCVLVDFEKRTV